MTNAQAGRDMLLKCQDANNSFLTVAGLRSRHLGLNAASVDITSAESAGRWRELLAGAGVRRLSLSGNGIFRSEATHDLVRQIFFDSAIRAWQIVIPHFGVIQAPFLIASLDYRGDHDAAIMFDIALESAGEPAFTSL